MVRLNAYLHQIKAATSDQCACGHARETIEHFLFHCTQWTVHRAGLLRCTETHRGNLSFYLGGKSPADTEKWTPNMEAVRATIRFAMATGRLDEHRPGMRQTQNETTLYLHHKRNPPNHLVSNSRHAPTAEDRMLDT